MGGSGFAIDPVTLEVVRNKLDVIAREMHATLMRSAYSILLKEGADCATALFDISGQEIAQGVAIPAQLGMLIPAVQRIIEVFPPPKMAEGDVYVVNDPYEGGTHLPDFAMVSPIFYDGGVVGLSAAIAHQVEIGGKTPGSLPIDASDIYQEGLRFPPLPLVKGGETNRIFFAFVEKNSRLPDIVKRDLRAMLAALRIGQQRVVELCGEYGVETLTRYIQEILDRSEVMTRKGIEAMPAGLYSFTDYLDNDGVDLERRIPITATVEIQGSEFRVDFAGTSPQVQGPVNTVSAHTSVYYILKAVTDPEIPNNAGCYRPIFISLPQASLLNPKPPAAVNSRTVTLKRLSDVLMGALVQAIPGRVTAAPGGNTLVISFAGIDPLTGRQYVTHELCVGGMGARPNKDGVDAIETDVTNTQTIPAEALECEYPLRVLRDRLWVDSAGPGLYRGGLGREKLFEMTRGEMMVVSYRGERHATAPWGLFGGGPGRPSRAFILRRDGSSEEIPSKLVFTLREGDRLHFFMPGGGGYGDPLQRPAEKVAEDVEDGKVSREAAAAQYGVVIDPETGAPNLRETERLRGRLRTVRGSITWIYDRGGDLGQE